MWPEDELFWVIQSSLQISHHMLKVSAVHSITGILAYVHCGEVGRDPGAPWSGLHSTRAHPHRHCGARSTREPMSVSLEISLELVISSPRFLTSNNIFSLKFYFLIISLYLIFYYFSSHALTYSLTQQINIYWVPTLLWDGESVHFFTASIYLIQAGFWTYVCILFAYLLIFLFVSS